MKTYRFYMPPVSLMGIGCLKEAGEEIKKLGFKKALIVTDKVLVKIGLVNKLTEILDNEGIEYVIFDETKPNPTVKNVEDGLKMLKENNCDFLISFGGGSPHDCAKGIGLVATNGGSIKDYEGVNKSAKPMLPLVAVNTTAGTASEMTRFSIITDEDRHVKMAIVDWHVTPIMAVNDPELMVEMPKALTAATGMDALTHAIEAYVSIDATPVTDAAALKAIELIFKYLKRAVENGKDIEARDKMAYAEYLAGVAFNNAGLGYVHAMAHQLGGFYDLPHGVCNAVLLPHVQAYNLQVVPERFIDIAKAMGINVENLTAKEAGEKVLEAIKNLSREIGIPSGLKELGVKEEDLKTLAENALKDACGFTNPKQASLDDIIRIFKEAM
ncbi:L-threonine dehydrogenase [Carboxydothermus hydrogenoformans]|uniref:Putative lactaldehyde reductase n=1 Tax=Carboxydothermus hydrogenoformans (strain ATCC BAA-161 / DSM 6008 / Z-2901) TaxID=246194 RepID=Q3ADL2_CARHZ|nr:L-threonine dehydrogenase [Carboxydothermus hydrogenoformans]ABB14374.1 putative lactaldehyde reductase [Carboxydothermus hydrogenoformans Z-2901]